VQRELNIEKDEHIIENLFLNFFFK